MTKQHIVKSVFWLTVSEIIFNISGYIIHSAVGRILGPSDYGRFGLIVTLTTMIIILIGNGIPTAMSKYLSEFFETKPEMVSIIKKQASILQACVIGGITAIFFLSAPLIAKLLGDPTLTPLLRISTFIIPSFAAASFYFYYYTGIHKFNLQSVLKTVRSVVRVVFIVGLAYFFKIKGSIAGYIVAPFFVFLIAFIIDKIWISKKFPKSSEGKFDWKELANYAWPITLFLLFYEILISSDLYLVKALLKNDYLTGIYNGSLTLARIPYYIFYALTIILLPTISKTTSQNKVKETQKIISQSLRLLLILLLPTVVLLYVYAQPIISLFYGNDYLPAVPSMQLLVLGVGFLTVFYIMSFVMNGAGKIKIPMNIAFFGMIANIFLNYILIQKYQLIGSAIATSITSVFIMIIMLFYIHRYFQGLIKISSFLKMLSAMIIMYCASLFFPVQQWTFLIYSFVLLAIYALTLLVLKELKKDDWELVVSLVSRKAKNNQEKQSAQ